MILLEFAAQGVRGVAPSGGRATLRPGYNVVAADGPALRRLLEALLHPDPRDAEALPRAGSGPAGAGMRAGLTLVGDDRVTYRLVRDFAVGCQLHRFDAEKRAFAPVSQELAEIRELLRSTVGVPTPARLSALLSLSAAELPSRQGPGVEPSRAAPPRAMLSPEQARRRVAQLEAELAQARVAEGLQERLDRLQARLAALGEALRAGDRLRDGLERALEARAELDAAAAAGAALGDAEAKLVAYERGSARRAEAIERAAAERATLDEVDARGAPVAPWRGIPFWAGAGAGLALALGGAAAAAAGSELRHAALLAVPAFGTAAWVAWEWVGRLEAWERVSRRRRVVDDWERKLQGAFERDAQEVRAALKTAGVQGVPELRELLSRVEDADAVVAEWRRRVAEWQAAPEAQRLAAERAQVEGELRAAEATFSEQAGGFVRDPASIEGELRRLQAEAAVAIRQEAPAPPPRATPAPGGDALRLLVERAAAEGGASPAAVVRGLAAKASQTLSGISFQRLQALGADERGNLSVQVSGRVVAAATLPPADRDLVFLAIKLALLEQALAGGKGVAIVEDAFAGLSDGARRFAARLLKQLARPGQLLHATADPAFREAADHAA
ncbi:hypothetical protein [Anaeromyxobacter sp. SG66]|uniref:hypothetical protein n=1 Tax=Anaeromyxobacter sp. SG66 TaxID=2925410 RepID=UPI001F5654FC|nr:hypothetical protein [Anaeromyxobacter sp. SG66]